MMFLDCPARLDHDGAARCGLPAEVRCRFTVRSTNGPLESARIRCPAGHWFNGPIESLIWESTDKYDPGSAAIASTAGHARLTGSHDGRAATGGSVIQHPGNPGQAIRRPNNAPAYYLGRPASLWITAMSPRRRDTASTHLIQATTCG
jgi:hypothetical protein